MEDIEDNDYVASEHDRLISAISKLDKTQHITDPTRNEATNINSEFNLIKRSNKLDLGKVVKVLGDTAHHVQIGKKLKKSQDASKILIKPLEKPQAERIKRATGYEQTKEKVGRWDPVVARNRTVDFVSFPIKHVSTKLQPTDEFISKFKLKSPLEKELDELDPPEVHVEEVEEQAYPMSYQEMVEHRQHLAKLRAQQSYKAAKAKRQSKIKSKKYHRILKKEKLKQQLKEFEDLQQKDPEEALKKLETLEKSRALERHTLRHKNTGKWAKSKLIRAKYDKEVRQELAEQLSVSRSLTHKVQNNDSTDDEPDNEAITNVALAQDPMNPWMMQRSDKSNVDAEFDFGYKKYLKDKMFKKREDSEDSDEGEANEQPGKGDLDIIKDGVRKMIAVENESSDDTAHIEAPIQKKQIRTKSESSQKKVQKSLKTSSKKLSLKARKLVATTNWMVESVEDSPADTISREDISTAFDSYENSIAGQVEKKLKQLRKNIEKLEKSTSTKRDTPKEKEERDNLEYLKLRNKKVKAVIDEELLETGSRNPEQTQNKEKPTSKVLQSLQTPTQATTDTTNTDSNIDPSRFIQVKPKYLNTALSDAEKDFDLLDDDEQVVPKVNIEEVFEEDDVVASFRQEKEDEANKDKPEDIDLSLPGWGTWGGKGVKAPKRRKNRFIIKAPPKVPRRDENKGDIIIKEYKNPKLTSHKVTEVPFPFTSVKEYEASIRAPLGNTFVSEKAHRKLIKPSVITKAGAIIDPMDEEELLVKKNRNFKNADVIALLGQK